MLAVLCIFLIYTSFDEGSRRQGPGFVFHTPW